MATLSQVIHDALDRIEAWIDKIEHEKDTGPTPPEVKAAVSTIRDQAEHVETVAPTMPAAPSKPAS